MKYSFFSNDSKYIGFKDWIKKSDAPLIVASPFVTNGGIALLKDEKFRGSTLVARGLPNDFISGAISVEALRELLICGWSVKFNKKLHAKIILNSGKECLTGSANLTKNGLSPYPVGNFETFAHFNEIPTQLESELDACVNDAIEIDLEYLKRIEEWVSKVKLVYEKIEAFPAAKERKKTSRSFFTLNDIPQTQSLKSIFDNYQNNDFSSAILLHDLNLLDLEDDFSYDDVKNSFKGQPLVIAFLAFLGEGERFGVLRRWLEEHVIPVPTPSREEYNIQLNKLYSLIIEAFDGEYYKSKPRYTEFLLKKC